jgi:hypothetical protein
MKHSHLTKLRDKLAEKTCTKCHKKYSGVLTDYFHVDRRRNGLNPNCKSCRRATQNRKLTADRHKRSYERTKIHHAARKAARTHFEGQVFMCSVVNCSEIGIDLHHVNYDLPLDVVPLCKIHHSKLHSTERSDAACAEYEKRVAVLVKALEEIKVYDDFHKSSAIAEHALKQFREGE